MPDTGDVPNLDANTQASMRNASAKLSNFASIRNPTQQQVDELITSFDEALNALPAGIRRSNGLDVGSLQRNSRDSVLVDIYESILIRGRRNADEATDAATDAADVAKGNMLKRHPKYNNTFRRFIGLAIRSQLKSEEECQRIVENYYIRTYIRLLFLGGYTDCKDCSDPNKPKVGPEEGGYSDENCCCQPPEEGGGEILTENTSLLCTSFCNEDCSLSNRMADARASAIENPFEAGTAAFDRGLDAVTTAATGAIDLATFFALYGVQIVVGLVVLIALPIIFYLFKGIVTGVKESGKVVSEAAKGKGTAIVKGQVSKLPGLRKAGRKKWKK